MPLLRKLMKVYWWLGAACVLLSGFSPGFFAMTLESDYRPMPTTAFAVMMLETMLKTAGYVIALGVSAEAFLLMAEYKTSSAQEAAKPREPQSDSEVPE